MTMADPAPSQPERRELTLQDLARIQHDQGTLIGAILDVQADHQARLTALEDRPALAPVTADAEELAAMKDRFLRLWDLLQAHGEQLERLRADVANLAVTVFDEPF